MSEQQQRPYFYFLEGFRQLAEKQQEARIAEEQQDRQRDQEDVEDQEAPEDVKTANKTPLELLREAYSIEREGRE
jgi:hypothetical protein